MIFRFFHFIFTLFFFNCAVNLPDKTFFVQEQGVEGYVYRISGNQMPSPSVRPSKPKGIATSVYIFELANIHQVSRVGNTAFYNSIRTKFVQKTESGADGHFSVQLPPGSYSFFTKKDELFYANWFDSKNNIAPVTVLPGKMTGIEIRVDYDAIY
jgi:hypothetical protein